MLFRKLVTQSCLSMKNIKDKKTSYQNSNDVFQKENKNKKQQNDMGT